MIVCRRRPVATLAAVRVAWCLLVLAGCDTAPSDRQAIASPAGVSAVEIPIFDRPGLDPAVADQFDTATARLERLRAASASDPSDRAWAWGELGELHHAYLNLDAATVCYREALRLDPTDPRWRYLLAQIERTQGRFEASSRDLQEVLARQPDDLPTRWWLAMNALDLGRADVAESWLREILARESGWTAAHLGLARVALLRDRPAEAFAALDQLDSALAASTEAIELQMAAHRAAGDLDAARRWSERLPRTALERRAIEIDDPLMQRVSDRRRGAQTAARRGMAAVRRGSFELAVEELERALARDPGRADVRYNLAASLIRLGRSEEARGHLYEAVERSPSHFLSRVLLARLLAAQGDVVPARAELAAALALDRESVAVWSALGDLEAMEGRLNLADDHYRRALAVDPAHEAALVGRAVLFERRGPRSELLAWLAVARARLPEQRTLRHLEQRCRALADPRDAERALADLDRRSRASGRTTVSDAETRALALATLGRFDDAIAWQQAALAPLEPRAALQASACVRSRRRPEVQ
ncbi:MAG: tetratricopeptide repeat protein, partial [Acidobacteriota bacterium]